MKKLKVIKIDVINHSIEEIEIEHSLRGMYKALECSMIESVKFCDIPGKSKDKIHDLYVDEEALIMKNVQGYFGYAYSTDNDFSKLEFFLFKGHGIICGFDGIDDWCNHSADIDALKERIRFFKDDADILSVTILN